MENKLFCHFSFKKRRREDGGFFCNTAVLKIQLIIMNPICKWFFSTTSHI